MKPGDLVTYTWVGSEPHLGIILESKGRWIRILWSSNLIQAFQIHDPEGWAVISEGW